MPRGLTQPGVTRPEDNTPPSRGGVWVQQGQPGTGGMTKDAALPARLFLMAVDAVVIAMASTVSLIGRSSLPWFESTADLQEMVSPLAGFIGVGWLAILSAFGCHNPRKLGVGTTELNRIVRGSVAAAAAVGISAYLSRYSLSRGYFFLLFLIGIPALVAVRLLVRWAINTLRRNGHLTTPVIIAGDSRHVEVILAALKREPQLGYRVIGALTHDHVKELGDVPVLGSPHDTAQMLHQFGARTIIFAEGSFRHARQFSELARALEEESVDMIVVPALTDISASRLVSRPVAGLPLLFVGQPRSQRASRLSKRAFDLLFSLLFIVLFAPVMLVATIAIRLEDGGPVLFRQRRVGIKGKEFICLKLRTMSTDAESRLAEVRASQEGADQVLFKLPTDPRITRTGRILRRLSIDELPQFWNVVRGNMSIVGPRPALPGEVEQYATHVHRRLDVRPGITGLWQVSGRSNLPWEETVRLDLYYVDNWSLFQDLAIVSRTVGAVLRGTGAY